MYQLIENYIVIAPSEEFSKYFFLNRKTWNSEEFNCLYDGIVYASCVSLGFALAENISYVIAYGFSVA
jgi:RsiW-degrading membrane proteinase PrsW (M82 family)